MLKTIIKKEILDQFISLRFLVLIVICLTVIPLSFYVSYQDYNNRVSDYNRSVQLHQEKLDNRKQSELFSGNFSVMGYRPPSPLGVFASGLSDATPQMFASQKEGLSFRKGSTLDESILTLTGKIDFLLVIQIVFSLLALLFTFDAICGEKEKGSLKAALSNAIPRDTVILGKYIGIMVTLLLPFIVSFLVGLILLIVLGYPLSGYELALRIFFIIIGSVVFISLFACIGLFVSSCAHSSKTSIVILLSIWILTVVVVPKGSHIVAKTLLPIRSEEVIELEKSLLRHHLELEKGRHIDDAEKTLPQPDWSRIGTGENEQIFEERNKVLNLIREKYNQRIEESIQKIERDYTLEKDRQLLLALSLARISPATSFNQIVTNLTWTGEYDKEKFRASAQAYQTVMNQELFNYVFRDIKPSGNTLMGVSRMINLQELPRFQYERASLEETFKSMTLDLVLMVFFSFFVFVLVYVSFLKYDVR